MKTKLTKEKVLDLGFDQPYEWEQYFTKEVDNGLDSTLSIAISFEEAISFEKETISIIRGYTGHAVWKTNDFTITRLELIILFFEIDQAFES